MKRKVEGIAGLIILSAVMMLAACAATSPKTVELSLVTEEQTVQIQKSHIRFVQGYYDKLRDEVTRFMEDRWIPLFLSKAVQNQKFRKDLIDTILSIAFKVFLGV